MTDIEKAKAYDEALERAANLYAGVHKGCKEVIDNIFPELCESEDERVRKGLVDFVTVMKSAIENGRRELAIRKDDLRLCDSWLAWLEKQKESSHVPETCKENTDSFTDACKDVIVAIEKYLDWLTGYPDYAPKGKYSIRDMLNCLYILEKQKEQKPEQYFLCDTIKDKIRSYISNHFTADEVVKTDVRSIVKAMEEGVRLGKEEQKPAEWGEEDLQHKSWILEHLADGERKMPEYAEDFRAAYKWLKSLRPQPKQEWNEEDEKVVKSIINYLSYDGTQAILTEEIDEWIAWLKSLRPSWKPSEDQMQALRYTLEYMPDSFKPRCTLVTLQNDLKKLM